MRLPPSPICAGLHTDDPHIWGEGGSVADWFGDFKSDLGQGDAGKVHGVIYRRRRGFHIYDR